MALTRPPLPTPRFGLSADRRVGAGAETGQGNRGRADAGAGPGLGRIVLAGLLLELLLILSFIPAPLVPLTTDSGMDELLPWLQALGRPLHERLALLTPTISLSRLAVVLEVACFLALFLPYAGVLRWLRGRGDRAAGRAVLLFGLLFQVTALCSRRLFSNDLFSYILNGRMMTVYEANPYLAVPARFPQDPFLPLVDWREVPNFYGPLWTLISAAITRLGGEELGLTLFLFRLVPAVATAAAGLLIWRLLRQTRPRQAALGAALWAWNPLVILEGAGSGHNDALLALLLVVAVGEALRPRPILGLPALAAAALVKYSAAILAPLYLVVLLRRARSRERRRKVLAGVGLAGALVVLSFLPFWDGGALAAGALVSSPARYLNSPAELLYAHARLWLGDDSQLVVERLEFRPWWAAARAQTDLFLQRAEIPIKRVEEDDVVLAINRSDGRWQRVYDPATRATGYIALADLRTTTRPPGLDVDDELAAYERGPTGTTTASLVNLLIRTVGWLVVIAAGLLLMRRATTHDDLLRGWLLLLVLVYWLVAAWFFPWYLIWGLAVAALRPRGPLVWSLVVWSAAVLLYYGLVTLEGDPALGWLYRWRAVPMFLPPLLLLLGARLAPRSLSRGGRPAAPSPAG